MTHTRRDFCKNTATMVAGASLVASVPALAGCSKSEKTRYGVIGINGMGFANLRKFMEQPDTELVALCDVDENILKKRTQEAKDYQKKLNEQASIANTHELEIRLYTDYRELIAQTDIDVVVINTPDHWHCLQFIEACEKGKDIYVEKPLANSISECILMEQYAHKHKTVVQVGQWQRSGQHWQDAMQYVHSGKLGPVRTVKCWAYLSWFKPVARPDGIAPNGVDYNFWLGPAAERPFNPSRFHFHFRWWWDYAGGLMTDWGVHLLDFALYGMKATTPKSIMSVGGHFSAEKGSMETPDTQTTIYEFDDFILQWEHAVGIDQGPYNRGHGVAFIGDKGTLVVDRGGWEVMPEKPGQEGSIEAVPRQTNDGKDHENHVRDFLDCLKTRKSTKASIEIGKDIAILAHMGNIAYRTASKLEWDSSKNDFIGNEAASAFIRPQYRGPWKLPTY